MVRLEPGNSGGRMRGNYEIGNEDKLRLKFNLTLLLVSSENSVLDQLIILKLIFFLILITYLVDNVLIL